MPALRPARKAASACVVLAVLLLPASAEAASQRVYDGKRKGRSVATFRIIDLDAERVRAAEVRSGRVRFGVSRVTVRRAAAGSGILRVRLSPKARRNKKPPKLVVVVEPAPEPTIEPAPAPAPAPIPAPAPATEPAPTPAPAPATEPAPTPAPAPATEPTPVPAQKITQWRAPGSPPLSDAEAAARVTRTAEIRPANETANHYWPSDADLAAFHGARYGAGPNAGALGDSVIPQQRHVTGRYAGTTDEILQWAAHKWGIPEDLLRAVAHQESTWSQGALGDRRTVADPSLYPAQARYSATQAYESMGLMQIKWRPDGSLHPGTEPLRWRSTAFNVDFYGAVVRFYFDGSARSWFSSASAYGTGQDWMSIGAWYQPTPWGNDGQLAYVEKVKAKIAGRTWQQAGF